MRKLCLGLLALVALGTQARAQTLTTMFRFNYSNGSENIWKPVSDGQGNLYGTAESGGTGGFGTVYRFTPGVSRTLETLHNFAGGTDGATPMAGLTYDDSGGMLYGTTWYGGVIGASCDESQGCGTIFSFNPTTGAYTTLYAFPGGAGGEVRIPPALSLLAPTASSMAPSTTMNPIALRAAPHLLHRVQVRSRHRIHQPACLHQP